MRFLLFVIPTVLIACVQPAKPPQKFFNPEFKWRITIPEQFESVGPEEWDKLQNRGAAAIEDTYGMAVNNQTTTLFVFKSGNLNYFESNYQYYDEQVDGDFAESVKAVNEALYQTFIVQMPGVTIDTLNSMASIDGLTFYSNEMKIYYPNKLTMYFAMYNRLFDDKELTVNIMYTDVQKGEKLKQAWLNSKFDL
ncbi:MAG: hypothetical protein J0L66_16875 [Cytophagales bacterium]|nr:hypothetical protein [Cytophagales bacterium]